MEGSNNEMDDEELNLSQLGGNFLIQACILKFNQLIILIIRLINDSIVLRYFVCLIPNKQIRIKNGNLIRLGN